MATTASGLARAFGIFMREIDDLLKFIPRYHPARTRLSRRLEVSQEDVNKFTGLFGSSSPPSLGMAVYSYGLNWSTTSIRSFTFTAANEPGGSAQGSSSSTTRPTNASLSRTKIGADSRAVRERGEVNVARWEFLSYSLSLARAHSSEHLDSLPVIDAFSLKRVS